ADIQRRLAAPLMNQNRLDEAEALLRESLAFEQAQHPADAQALLAIRELLANVAYFNNDLDAAGAEYEAALALSVARYGPVHSSVALSQGNIGTVAFKRGDFAEAEKRYRQSIETFRAFYGVDNDQVAAQLRSLALTLRRLQRHDEALAA